VSQQTHITFDLFTFPSQLCHKYDATQLIRGSIAFNEGERHGRRGQPRGVARAHSSVLLDDARSALYLKHNCVALDDLEQEVRTAAQLGQVSIPVPPTFILPEIRSRSVKWIYS
jgi:hypothetical protein